MDEHKTFVVDLREIVKKPLSWTKKYGELFSFIKKIKVTVEMDVLPV